MQLSRANQVIKSTCRGRPEGPQQLVLYEVFLVVEHLVTSSKQVDNVVWRQRKRFSCCMLLWRPWDSLKKDSPQTVSERSVTQKIYSSGLQPEGSTQTNCDSFWTFTMTLTD